MIEKLRNIEQRYNEISMKLASPDIFNNQDAYKKLTRELKDIEPVVEKYRQMKDI